MHVQWRAYMKKLNSVVAIARYLENVSLLRLHESDNLYIEHNSSMFVEHVLL